MILIILLIIYITFHNKYMFSDCKNNVIITKLKKTGESMGEKKRSPEISPHYINILGAIFHVILCQYINIHITRIQKYLCAYFHIIRITCALVWVSQKTYTKKRVYVQKINCIQHERARKAGRDSRGN